MITTQENKNVAANSDESHTGVLQHTDRESRHFFQSVPQRGEPVHLGCASGPVLSTPQRPDLRMFTF